MVPTDALPPAIPFTAHVTLVDGLPEPVTVAVKTCVPPAGTVADGGETLTAMSSCKVTVAEPVAAVSAALAATIVTFAGDGKAPGAV